MGFSMRYDVMVLGAGIVGTSIAAHLQERGRSVALVDRRGPGEETSYGNSGVVEEGPMACHREVGPELLPTHGSIVAATMRTYNPKVRLSPGTAVSGL